MLESPTAPGTFIAPCGFTERSFTLSKETNETTSVDCDDEDKAAFVDRDVVSKSASISGEGVLARESLPRWRAAFERDEPVLARIEIGGTAAQGGGYWQGLFHITSLEVGATRGERATLSVEMPSSGAVAWVDAAT
jgi:TP901-1 family phage major tail protein